MTPRAAAEAAAEEPAEAERSSPLSGRNKSVPPAEAPGLPIPEVSATEVPDPPVNAAPARAAPTPRLSTPTPSHVYGMRRRREERVSPADPPDGS